MIRFEILDSPTVTETLDFGADPSAQVIKIGRVASAALRFQDDDQVSRMHAIIESNRSTSASWSRATSSRWVARSFV